MELSIVDEELAHKMLETLYAYERYSDEPEAFETGEVMKDLKYVKSVIEMVSLSLWYDIYVKGITEKDARRRSYLSDMLRGFKVEGILEIKKEVANINEAYLGQKQILEKQDSGSQEVKDLKKIQRLLMSQIRMWYIT